MKKKLGVFFTRGVSLKMWMDTGLITREKVVYEKYLLRKDFVEIYWYTYGTADRKYSIELKKAGILSNDIIVIEMPEVFSRIPGGTLIYSFLLPLLKRKTLKESYVLKTNQLNGSWSALFVSLIWHIPVLLRCGYLESVLLQKQKKLHAIKYLFVKFIEKLCFKAAQKIVLTSDFSKAFIISEYCLPQSKIQVVPSYIETDIFSPNLQVKKYTDRILFIGRLSEEKNLLSLNEAIQNTSFSLDLIGTGSLKERLVEQDKYGKLRFFDNISNDRMPELMNKYKYFILPSFSEGMPKALLEAMSCGLLCIGTNVSGISELIIDNKTGVLIKGTDVQSIRDAICSIHDYDITKITITARKLIVAKYSFEQYYSKEKNLLLGLTA